MSCEAVRPEPRSDADDDGAVDTGGRVCELVRCLVRSILVNTPSSLDPAQELILDVEVDGVRYMLIRPARQMARIQSLLSPREFEIACMIAGGYPNKVVAAALDISTWTVCTHIRRIFAKLGVSSRAAIVARIVEEGFVAGSSAPRGCGASNG